MEKTKDIIQQIIYTVRGGVRNGIRIFRIPENMAVVSKTMQEMADATSEDLRQMLMDMANDDTKQSLNNPITESEYYFIFSEVGPEIYCVVRSSTDDLKIAFSGPAGAFESIDILNDKGEKIILDSEGFVVNG